MHTHDVGAVEDGGGDRRHGAVEAIFGGSGRAILVCEDAADEGFARGADQERIVWKCGDELIELRDELEVLFLTLSKTDSRIDHDCLALYSATLGHVDTRTQAVCDLLHDVGDWRQAMHRGRCATRVHQHQPCTGSCHGV